MPCSVHAACTQAISAPEAQLLFAGEKSFSHQSGWCPNSSSQAWVLADHSWEVNKEDTGPSWPVPKFELLVEDQCVDLHTVSFR